MFDKILLLCGGSIRRTALYVNYYLRVNYRAPTLFFFAPDSRQDYRAHRKRLKEIFGVRPEGEGITGTAVFVAYSRQ